VFLAGSWNDVVRIAMTEGGCEYGGVRIVRATRNSAAIPGPVPSPSESTPEGLLILFTEDWRPVEAARVVTRAMIEAQRQDAKGKEHG